MNIFSRDNNAASGDADDLDLAMDGDAGFDDTADGGLSAPQRGGDAAAGSSKKTLMLLLVLLLIGGGFGGMFLFDGEQAAPLLPPSETVMSETPVPVDLVAPDTALVTAADDAMMPPMPDMPPMPSSTGEAVPAEAVPAEAAITDAAMTTDVNAPLGEVPPVPPAPPQAVTTEPAAADLAPIQPAVEQTAATPEAEVVTAQVVAPAASVDAAAVAQAQAEPPSAEAQPSVTPGVDTAIETPTTPAADVVLADADSVEAVVEEVQPSGQSPEDIIRMWSALPVEDAMVRPLPKAYVTVQKKQSADSLDSRLAAAQRALSDGRTVGALQFFTDLQADYPNDSRVLMGRAVALQRLGQNAEALTAYESVLVSDPKNLDALTNMLGLLRQQNPQLALDKLTDLRALYPYNGDIATQLAVTYGQMGNLTEALRYITLAEALKPESDYVLYNKAVLYDRMGRTTEAADMYRQLIRAAADGTLDQNLPIESLKKRLTVMR